MGRLINTKTFTELDEKTFLRHNRKTPIIYGFWRSEQGYMYYLLADNTYFKADVKFLNKNIKIKWGKDYRTCL